MAGGANSQKQLKEETTKTEDTSKAPGPMAAPYFPGLYEAGQKALNATNTNPFVGNFVAQPSEQTNASAQMLSDLANSGRLTQGVPDFMNMATKTAQGGYLDPSTNPYLAQAASSAIRPVTQQLQTSILPGIRDAAISSGAYGGARQDLQENQAVDNWSRTAGDLTNNMFYQNYADERNRQMQAGNLLGQGQTLLQAPAQVMGQSGNIFERMQQQQIDNALQQHKEQQTAPWYGLGELSNLLTAGGYFQGTGTSTSNTVKDNPNYEDPFTQALKIAIGGASTIAGVGGKGGFNLFGAK